MSKGLAKMAYLVQVHLTRIKAHIDGKGEAKVFGVQPSTSKTFEALIEDDKIVMKSPETMAKFKVDAAAIKFEVGAFDITDLEVGDFDAYTIFENPIPDLRVISSQNLVVPYHVAKSDNCGLVWDDDSSDDFLESIEERLCDRTKGMYSLRDGFWNPCQGRCSVGRPVMYLELRHGDSAGDDGQAMLAEHRLAAPGVFRWLLLLSGLRALEAMRAARHPKPSDVSIRGLV
ncbi:hypothetical protein ISN45_Aa01g035120 [Arabidopsis thaliana x Arabidopsis arenosa]|uniref:DUF1204 domain-containing protein n=1 Tax=Arabidopsis thaliana x Arabidopsis arenosa TaxID=1240361 RepID=A0A8T2C3V3_9BRAS|nr:hypothetical protein ISN45_Aa01g035120 [Arabidopsis thaliana x Arabidopsis arenosa]